MPKDILVIGTEELRQDFLTYLKAKTEIGFVPLEAWGKYAGVVTLFEEMMTLTFLPATPQIDNETFKALCEHTDAVIYLNPDTLKKIDISNYQSIIESAKVAAYQLEPTDDPMDLFDAINSEGPEDEEEKQKRQMLEPEPELMPYEKAAKLRDKDSKIRTSFPFFETKVPQETKVPEEKGKEPKVEKKPEPKIK